jgi:Arc/MetJ-type ribon-helix-helix transcriptional regulator
MARTQTIVQLTDEIVRHLDDEAARRGVSRSGLIREAVERWLATSSERAEIDRLVAAYRAIPPATPDAWGDLAAAGDIATRETMQRLDAEEAAAGLEPW